MPAEEDTDADKFPFHPRQCEQLLKQLFEQQRSGIEKQIERGEFIGRIQFNGREYVGKFCAHGERREQCEHCNAVAIRHRRNIKRRRK